MLSAVGANANDVVETSRECQSPKMQAQGVLPKDCPRNRISRAHCSARSCAGGFVVSTKVFFEAPKNPNLFEPLTLCHVERSRSECDDVVETSRGCQSPKMQTQGVLPKDCHRNRISRPHCSARSCQQKLQLEPLRTLTILAWQSGENASYLRRYNQHSRDVSTPRRDDARVSSLNMTGY
jgi:hypothetical protein